MSDEIDIRNKPCVEIVDLYSKDGKHVSSTCKAQDGRVIWHELANPNKDIAPFVDLPPWPWSKYGKHDPDPAMAERAIAELMSYSPILELLRDFKSKP